MSPTSALKRQAPAESTPDPAPDGDETTPSVPVTGSTRELPIDVIFELLSAGRRRHVLNYLFDEDDSTTLGDLARHLAAIENDKPVRAVMAAERKRVYIALYQCHLPKMDDAGVIEFDSDRGTVKRAANADVLLDYLPPRGVSTTTLAHPQYPFAVALLGGGLLATQHTLFPATWLSGLVAGGLLTIVTLLAVQAYRQS